MHLSEAVNGFLLSFVADGHSENTVNICRNHLGQLAEFLGDPELADITSQDITRFAAWLRTGYIPQRRGGDTSPYSPSSISNTWCAIRSFYNWASTELSTKRPDKGWKQPKWKRPVIAPFSQDGIAALLKSVEYTRPAKTGQRSSFRMRRPTANRDQAMMLVLLDTGLRISECARLRIQDLTLESGEVYVLPYGTGRKTKSRHVYLGKTASKAVWRYLAEREGTDPDERLFVTLQGRPMNRIGMRWSCGASAKQQESHRQRGPVDNML